MRLALNPVPGAIVTTTRSCGHADGTGAARYGVGLRSATAGRGGVRRPRSIEDPSRPVVVRMALDRRPMGTADSGDIAAAPVASNAGSRAVRRSRSVGWAGRNPVHAVVRRLTQCRAAELLRVGDPGPNVVGRV